MTMTTGLVTTIKIAALIAVLSLFPFRALADGATVLRMGADMTHYANQTSIYSLGYEEVARDGFGHKIEAGFWTDTGSDRKGSPFGSLVGLKRFGDYEGVNVTGVFGIMIVGYPDAALASAFEFTEEIAIGFKDVSIGYKHISNAGLKEPNHGRDYIFLNLALPL